MRLPVRRAAPPTTLELGTRRTIALGVAAAATTAALIAMEVSHVRRRGRAEVPGEVARETLEVAVEGYRAAPRRETALFTMLVSFALTFLGARYSTHVIRRHGRWGPFRDLKVDGRHIHHFIPGIALAFLAGGVAISTRGERLEPWLAVPFGAGLGLTFDESALLLELEDVYWTEEGVASVQITCATLALLSSLALALRILRRGEQRVLGPPPAGD